MPRSEWIDADMTQAVTAYFAAHPEAGPAPLFHHRLGLARAVAAVVADLCAKRAEYGDFTTGMDCAQGYHHKSPTAAARKQAADDIRALVSAALAPPAKTEGGGRMSDWQPIETAPRDGRQILVREGYDPEEVPLVMAWHPPNAEPPEGWWLPSEDSVVSNGLTEDEYSPLLWAVIPAPPPKGDKDNG